MQTLSRRTTLYLDPPVHRLLRLKAAETGRSVSDLVNEAIRQSLAEDADDLAAFEERAAEPVISYAAALKELSKNGSL